jgi:diguanylate cyclase (GGDEF)-like protein/PAS domain S-box-containing protein
MFDSIKEKIFLWLKINNKNKYKYESFKICLKYIVLSFLWIFLSDRVSNQLVKNRNMLLVVNTYKGWFFVLVSSTILFFLILNLLDKIHFTEKELSKSNAKLSEANQELQAYIQQLKAAEEELRDQYDRILESEKRLNISEERNRAIIKAMPDLLFILNKEGRFIDCLVNDESRLLIPVNGIIGKTVFEIMPDDIAKTGFEKIQSIMNQEGPQSFEYLLEIRNQRQYFEMRIVKSGHEEVLAISRNITDSKEIELKLKASEMTFRTLFEGSSDAIFIVNDNSIIIDCNMAAVELLGYDAKEMILGQTPWGLSPEKQPDGNSSEERVLEVIRLSQNNRKVKFEWWHAKKDGSLIPVEIMLTYIFLDGNKVFHALCRDISERKQMEDKLAYLSFHDPLTGLYNRRFFEEELKRLDVKRNLPLTLVMADMNGLKLVNDSFGHMMGDKLLKKMAEVLVKGCRADDIIARLAGDEFVIVLPKIDVDQAELIIRRIKAISAQERVAAVELSIAFGWETKYSEEEDIENVLLKAEANMYKNKLLESPSMRGKTINVIISTLHEKNKREEQHSHRVSLLCKSLGEALGLAEMKIKELETVGLLHDIGKVAIEENVLNKPGRLTAEEWEEIKRHPEIGYRILNTVKDMSEMAEYVLHHHEYWNGKGYPKGLKAEEIPFQSRIIAIADAYDAITSERSYRSALSKDFAIEELRRNAGVQFDPHLVKVFTENVVLNLE